MKRVIWLPLGLVGLIVVLVLLFVSRSQYGELEADYDALQADLASVQASYDSLEQELDNIKKVYPPRDFSSEEELKNWLLQNDVSDMPAPSLTDIEARYALALKIQEDALADGYIISADFDYPIYIFCVAIIDGYIWVCEPESDDAFLYQGLDQIK